jgi:H+-transporting ATPase
MTEATAPEQIAQPQASIGISSAEAERRLREFGPNAMPEEIPARWRLLLAKFWAPVPWMLEATIALQLALGETLEAAVVAFLLVFNMLLGFFQESRANAALAALKRQLAPTAWVARDGAWVQLPAAEIVPGDAVKLRLGAVVPADARVLAGAVLVDQSLLTGESVPVEAGAGSQVYAGALIRRGEAIAVVTATGARTFFGRTAELVRIAHAASSEQKAVFAATRNLGTVNGTIAILLIAYAIAEAFPPSELVRLALTALLASVPVALPATFTLSAALTAQTLARCGVLLTRLSAAHEAATMDVLCSDKTGTLTQNVMAVAAVVPLPGYDRTQVLSLAALASSEGGGDPIDATIRRAAAVAGNPMSGISIERFVPFDPATKISEAFGYDAAGQDFRIVKGALQALAALAAMPPNAQEMADQLAHEGHRVIAVAAGPPKSLRLAGLIALSDPPREDSARLIANLRALGVHTVMVTGDSMATAIAIARQVGIEGGACSPEHISQGLQPGECGIFARVVPEEKYRLVIALQRQGHVVGMCGDGANDAPALRQAQIGIAVSSATDVAKAAAAMVLTQPGLSGIVAAVQEGRIAFQRLLTYTLNMLVKKIEIVLFLTLGLILTGQAVMTPVLMVIMLVTNDFLSMSLMTDRATADNLPSRWHMRGVTAAAIVLGMVKLGFSTTVLTFARWRWGLVGETLQTLAFITLVFGNQALLFALRERHRLWSSRPSGRVLASSATDIAVAAVLALSGTLMAPLPWRVLLAVLLAAAAFALILDRIKTPVMAAFRVGRGDDRLPAGEA